MRLVLPYLHEMGFRPPLKRHRRAVEVRAYASFEIPEIAAWEADEVVTPGDWERLDRAHRRDVPATTVRFGYRDRVFKPVHLSQASASPQTYEAALGIPDPSRGRVEQLAREGWWSPAVPGFEPSSDVGRFPLAYPLSGSIPELLGTGVAMDDGDRRDRWRDAARELQENIVVIDGLVHVACYDPVWTLRDQARLAILLEPTRDKRHRHFRLDRLDAATDFFGLAASPYDRSGNSWPWSRHLRRDDVVALAEGLLPTLPAIRHAIARQEAESDAAIRCFEVAGQFAQKTRLDRNEAEELLEALSAASSAPDALAKGIIGSVAHRELMGGIARWRFESEYLDEADRHAVRGI